MPQKSELEPMPVPESQTLWPDIDIQDIRASSKREAMPEQMSPPLDMPTIGEKGPTDDWCISNGRSCGAAPTRCCKGLKCESVGEPDGFTWMGCKPA
ncbi:hypothetical protein ACJ72_04143 [Emergomyces africanus]|uniref:Uncharacterized protein n=1 Tax=Emergomyces africanus TaxID=1955775 RepID=A0A1B7NXJ8_9EURO|nr:hypothetical protein ACJ72_04143 [Emergomyces africanus]